MLEEEMKVGPKGQVVIPKALRKAIMARRGKSKVSMKHDYEEEQV